MKKLYFLSWTYEDSEGGNGAQTVIAENNNEAVENFLARTEYPSDYGNLNASVIEKQTDRQGNRYDIIVVGAQNCKKCHAEIKEISSGDNGQAKLRECTQKVCGWKEEISV